MNTMPTEPRDHDSLPGWLQPFSRVLAVLDALPGEPGQLDHLSLAEALPRAWPKVGDLRRLVQAFAPGTTPPGKAD